MTDPRTSPQGPRHRRARGVALIEFAFVLPVLLMIGFATIDFGRLIQSRLILTNVSREGASIGSRDIQIDPSLAGLLIASASPLDIAGADGTFYITRITAGPSKDSPFPTITTQIRRGSLAVPSRYASQAPYLGLAPNIHEHLVFHTANNAADLSSVTMVEIYYKYRPITPIPGFIPGILKSDGGGMIISSRAIF
jgi:Flp pilus assembly protein TadG